MPTALVLGGYGLIGTVCCRALSDAGFEVIGLGRSAAAAARSSVADRWIIRDLTKLDEDAWREVLTGVDVVVNAAGALQDGPGDDLDAVHDVMMARLCRVAPPDLTLVQISAAGAQVQASTAFLRSKARGDAHVQAAPCAWVILRPVLVLAPDAYGGTALLRAAAALPGVLPAVLPDSLIQTVHVADVAAAVVAAAQERVAPGTLADLTEDDARPLPDLMLAIRRWQGFADPAWTLRVPDGIVALIGRLADAAGWLGWRGPLRTTALAVLREGVRGDPAAWAATGAAPCRPLAATLAALPATRQERLYARLYLALPLAVVTLSLFWVLSGLLALSRPAAAGAVLAGSGLAPWAVTGTVLGGGLADLALGLAILWRPWCRGAALGMVALSVLYLTGGTLLTPQLWLDPLGPLIKVLPSTVLALVVWLGVEPR